MRRGTVRAARQRRGLHQGWHSCERERAHTPCALSQARRARHSAAQQRAAACGVLHHGAGGAYTQRQPLSTPSHALHSAQGAELMAEAQRVLNILYTRREMTPNEARRLLRFASPRCCSQNALALLAPHAPASRSRFR